MLRRFFRILSYLPSLPKTLLFNFRYFPLSVAIRLPVYVSWRVRFVKLGGTVKLHNLKSGNVRIGFGEPWDRTVWHIKGRLELAGNADFRAGSCLAVHGDLTIGKGFAINAYSTVTAMHRITIGENVLLSQHVSIFDSDFHAIYDADGNLANAPRPVEIGDKVWIGFRCLILKGARLPSESVVGAGAVVTGQFETPQIILAGVPARIVDDNITWRR